VVRNAVRDAINNLEANEAFTLHITASTVDLSGSVVNLTHDLFTNIGNITITETVTDTDFAVSGMSGGAGGDCAAGQTCRVDADCVSNFCQSNGVCQ
jgi:hypothetical protein